MDAIPILEPRPVPDPAAVVVHHAGALGGLLFAVLTGLAGGSVGPGRMSDVGASLSQTGPAGALALGVGGLLGGVAMAWWLRRHTTVSIRNLYLVAIAAAGLDDASGHRAHDAARAAAIDEPQPCFCDRAAEQAAGCHIDRIAALRGAAIDANRLDLAHATPGVWKS